MEKTENIKKRIVRVSNALRIEKDGKNTFSNYDYFKPDDILKNLNPLLEEYNLITLFNLKSNGDYYTAHLTIEDTDSDDKVSYEFDISKAIVKGANEAQNSGATLTYAKRYSLMNAFNIADNEDDFDSEKSNKEINKKKENTPKNPINTKSPTRVKAIIDEIAIIAKEKSSKSDSIKVSVKALLEKYHESGNPYKVSEIEKAKELLSEIKKI